jgi:hypothetical protein
MTIKSSVKSLFSQIIDYAGIFPPAKLPFNEALDNYLTYLQSPNAWLLSRFVCPASQLGELKRALSSTQLATPLTITVVTSSLEDAVRQIPLEAPPSSGSTSSPSYYQIRSWEFPFHLSRIPEEIVSLRDPVFLELPLDQRDPKALREMLGQLASANEGRPPNRKLGIKIRCGGEKPDGIPSSSILGNILLSCRKLQIPLKATAGLHHALPVVDPKTGVRQHGFLNLFVAAALVRSERVGKKEVEKIIESETLGSIQFTDEEIKYRGLSVSADLIEKARSELLTSFGSCNFEEPVSELKSLGLI